MLQKPIPSHHVPLSSIDERDKTYSVRDVATECGVAISTVHYQIKRGILGFKPKKVDYNHMFVLSEEQARILIDKLKREDFPEDGRAYYTLQEAASILGVTYPCITHKIKTGILDPLPAKFNGIYALTEDDINRLRKICVGGKTLKGQKYDKKADWPLLFNPAKLKTLNQDSVATIAIHQKSWFEFLNGEWTCQKPNGLGWFAVMARDKLGAQYRYFRSEKSKEQWAGFWWSTPLPFPPKEIPKKL